MKRSRKSSPLSKQMEQDNTGVLEKSRKSSERAGQMTYLDDEMIEQRIASQNQPSSVRNLRVPAMFDAAFRVEHPFEEAKKLAKPRIL